MPLSSLLHTSPLHLPLPLRPHCTTSNMSINCLSCPENVDTYDWLKQPQVIMQVSFCKTMMTRASEGLMLSGFQARCKSFPQGT